MSHKIKYYSALIGLILITGSWLWINCGVLSQTKETNHDKLNEIDRRISEMETVKNKYPDIDSQLSSWGDYLNTLKLQIPTKILYMDQLQTIRELAEKHQIEILSFSPDINNSFPAIHSLTGSIPKHIERYPVLIRLFGTYLNVGAFCEELQEIETVVNIGNIKFETELSRSGGVVCHLILFTYMFEEGRKLSS